jgi:hypothetical protein
MPVYSCEELITPRRYHLLKNVEEMMKFNYMYFYKCLSTSKKSHAYLPCVQNHHERFGECQPKGARGIGYTK